MGITQLRRESIEAREPEVGFEPTAYGLQNRCSDQLSYSGAKLMVGELRRAELVPNQWDHVVGIRVAPEHRLLEDEVAVDVDVEDPARAGHDLNGADDVLELL